MGLELQFIEFSPGYRTRAAFTIQHQGMYQPHCAFSSSNIRIPFFKKIDQNLLGHCKRAWRDDHAVIVRIDVMARMEGHARKGYGHVQITDTALVGFIGWLARA